MVKLQRQIFLRRRSQLLKLKERRLYSRSAMRRKCGVWDALLGQRDRLTHQPQTARPSILKLPLPRLTTHFSEKMRATRSPFVRVIGQGGMLQLRPFSSKAQNPRRTNVLTIKFSANTCVSTRGLHDWFIQI